MKKPPPAVRWPQSCGAAARGSAGSWARIESADAQALTLRSTDGHVQSIPLQTVAGVSVRNRDRGMFVGAVSLGTFSGPMGWGFAAA